MTNTPELPNYSQQDFADGFVNLLPPGLAWPPSRQSELRQSLFPLAKAYATNASYAAGLVVDIFPATTVQLIPEWFETLGLPGPCSTGDLTTEQSELAIMGQLNNAGTTSKSDLIAFAAARGYTITITDYTRPKYGFAHYTDKYEPRNAPFVWLVTIISGANPALLECELRLRNPAHELLVVYYSGSYHPPAAITLPYVSISGGSISGYTPPVLPHVSISDGVFSGEIVFAPAWTTPAGSLGTFAGNTAIVPVLLVATNTTSYVVTTGSLPTGLALNSSSGFISGTPSTVTNTTTTGFTVTAEGAGGNTARGFSATISNAPASAPIWITTAGTLGTFVPNVAITPVHLVATNTTTYVVTTGSLPTGLALNSTSGFISGTPSTANTTSSFSVTAEGTGGNTAQAFSATISNAVSNSTLMRLSTSGGNIVDSTGNTVVLRGVNVFGTESTNYTPHGLWQRSYTGMIDEIAGWNMNLIRLPLSADMTLSTAPLSIDYSANPDLTGLTAIQVLDKFIDYAGSKGIYCFLDCHRLTAGAGTDSALATGTLSNVVTFWQMLATHYADNLAVIGGDLYNEPHTLDWATVNGFYGTIGNAVHAIAPDWLVVCEGVGVSNAGSSYWWGGQLADAGANPVSLTIPNKVVYSAHDYGQSVGTQTWLETTTSNVVSYPTNLPAIFEAAWGYLANTHTAPVIVGEFGGKLGYAGNGAVDATQVNATYEQQWITQLVDYMVAKGISCTYWAYQPVSSDTGGLLCDDFTTEQTGKLALIAPLFP